MRGARVAAVVSSVIFLGVLASCSDEEVALSPSACGGCDANALCRPGPGNTTPHCECREGYTGDGKTCSGGPGGDEADCGGTCDENARCVLNADESPICRCDSGFTGNGRSCSPVVSEDDCGGCDENASCVSSDSGALCRCDAGFVGDGKSCRAPQSCEDSNGGCHARADCDDSGGEIACTCAHGFVGDGFRCLPPVGGYVKLVGSISLEYQKGDCRGDAYWDFDLRMPGSGARYSSGEVTTSVWKASATVDFLDYDTGEIALDLNALTWLNHSCPGRIEFQWSNAKGNEGTWVDVPASAELGFFGEQQPWYWSAGEVTLTKVQSTLMATFETP